MIHNRHIHKTMIFIAVMLMIFCIGGWLTGLATLGDDAMRRDPKVEGRIVDAFDDAEKVEVIVILEESETVEGRRGIQSEVLDTMENFEVKYKYSSFNGFSGKIDKYSLNELRFNSNIKGIYLNDVLNIHLDDSIPLINADYIQDTELKDKYLRGRGQSICVIDTGVNYNHPNLKGRVIGGWNYVNNDADYMDDHGHGTHVSGIVASNDTTYTGVAPESTIVAIKACNSTGGCNRDNVLAGINWCVNNASLYNISVISMSLGGGNYNTDDCASDFHSVANTAVANGILVIASSGNDGHSNGIAVPACSANITSVGATDKSDVVWSNSNTDEILDLLAPGVSINSTVGVGFETSTGTSMAAPHVAGVAALIYQSANISGDSITPDEIRDKMKNTGVNITDSRNNLTFPRVNAKEAVLISRLVVGDLASPYPKSNANMDFYANYTNRTSNAAISDGNCTISFTDMTLDMPYNASQELYIAERNFTSPATYSYNVTCNSSDFETLIESSTVEVVQGSENCTYPGSNIDWNVTASNSSWCIGENLIINQSNINIESGAEFVLNDTNITLIDAATDYTINVSGSITLKNVFIKSSSSSNPLDLEIVNYGDIYDSTFENSSLIVLGDKNHNIENCTFNDYGYFKGSSTNSIINSTFEDFAYFQEDSNNEINGSEFNSRVYIYDNSILNFSDSNLTDQIIPFNSPTISGSVDMPGTATMFSNNLTRFYPITVYYNDGATVYPNRLVSVNDSDGNTIFEGTTDSNGIIEINLTLNTTNYAIGNFTVSTNESQDVGLLTDTPITLQSSDDVPNGGGGNGGGGGGGTVIECIESWVCSPWSVCANNSQTRICVDQNKCNTTNDKPNETQWCEEAFMPELISNGGSGSGSNSGSGDNDLQIHEDERGLRDCCLWGICWRLWGLCWYWWLLILFVLAVSLSIWWNMEKKKKKKKVQKALIDAFGIDWTLKHLHIK
jgi:subtilisin family serine protease